MVILLVDDDPIILKIQSRILENYGYLVIESASGKQAINILATHSVGLVIMDMHMPEWDGLESTRQIRQLGYRLPIIALTGNATPEDRKLCLEAGMDGFLAKPITIEAFKNELLALNLIEGA